MLSVFVASLDQFKAFFCIVHYIFVSNPSHIEHVAAE